MVKSRVKKEIDRVYNEINEYLEEKKDSKERINNNRKKLIYLKADVQKPKIPFRRCMLSLARKKERRLKNVQRKLEIGINKIKK